MVMKQLTTQGLDELGSKEQLRLLDAVDSLRSQGISQHVSLPQIIVCGDQSSGKSSVLEAISGVSFPVKADTGTRFPTELILRRTNYINVKVSIVPHHARTDGEKKSLSDYREELESFQDLPGLIENAKAAMGIMTLGKAFSKDILRIEISGPDRPHLTIVDLPGVIHSENKHQSQEDIQLITDVVKEYMKEPRSVILAVISAKNDYPNQIVLNLARKADPKGLRTLGVITKPDFLKSGSPSERTYLSLAKNVEVSFQHGWHVLKNRDTDADEWDLSERNEREKQFFEDSNWSSLQPSQLGIKALRERLSKLLLHQIASELPNLKEEITTKLVSYEEELAKLGNPRSTAHEQRFYLVQVSNKVQILLKAAIDGTYNDPFFGRIDSLVDYRKRIRAVIQKRNSLYAQRLSLEGHYYNVCAFLPDAPGRGGQYILREKYIDKIVDMVERNKGKELPGMFNPLIVTELFQKQSSPWQDITEKHIKETWDATRIFMKQLITHVADPATSRAILEEIMNPELDTILAQLRDKVASLLKPHQDGHPITYNHFFAETLQNVRTERLKSKFIEIVRRFATQNRMLETTIVATQFEGLVDTLINHRERDMDRFAASEALDCADAYYEVALKRFIDDIAVQAIETSLVVGLNDIFNPLTVAMMSEKEIARIAGESEESREARRVLQEKIQIMRKGAETCREFSGFRLGNLEDPQSDEEEETEALDTSEDPEQPDSDDEIVEAVPEVDDGPVPVEAEWEKPAEEPAEEPMADGHPSSDYEPILPTGGSKKKKKGKKVRMEPASEDSAPPPTNYSYDY